MEFCVLQFPHNHAPAGMILAHLCMQLDLVGRPYRLVGQLSKLCAVSSLSSPSRGGHHASSTWLRTCCCSPRSCIVNIFKGEAFSQGFSICMCTLHLAIVHGHVAEESVKVIT